MANTDLVNEIEPQHPFRPVKTRLQDLRNAINSADTEGQMDQDYLDRLNYNDLVAVARHFGVELPVAYAEPVEEPVDPEA